MASYSVNVSSAVGFVVIAMHGGRRVANTVGENSARTTTQVPLLIR